MHLQAFAMGFCVKTQGSENQMLSLEDGMATDGILETRKQSRSKEMVFGHSIL